MRLHFQLTLSVLAILILVNCSGSPMPAAHKTSDCQIPLNFSRDIIPSLKPANISMVVSSGKMIGYRVHNVDPGSHLGAYGIADGDLLTHACGIRVSEMLGAEEVCCSPGDNAVELIFEHDGGKKKLKVPTLSQDPPNKALELTLDPVAPFAAAEGTPASRAAELRR